MSHLFSGMCESSKIVPMVTRDFALHIAHWRSPARIPASLFAVTFQNFFEPLFLQGHSGLDGQRLFSNRAMADSS
jgi:hypothetical protein